MQFQTDQSVRLLRHKGKWMIHLIHRNRGGSPLSVLLLPDKGAGDADVDRSPYGDGCGLTIPYGDFEKIARRR